MSEEADEIANRIFEACSPKSRFHRDMVTAMHKAEIKTGDGYEIISSSIADQLIKLGYVKVVRCGECRWLEERVVWQAAGGEASKMYICKSPHSHMKGIARFDGDYYCSEGERVEKEMSNEDDNL